MRAEAARRAIGCRRGLAAPRGRAARGPHRRANRSVRRNAERPAGGRDRIRRPSSATDRRTSDARLREPPHRRIPRDDPVAYASRARRRGVRGARQPCGAGARRRGDHARLRRRNTRQRRWPSRIRGVGGRCRPAGRRTAGYQGAGGSVAADRRRCAKQANCARHDSSCARWRSRSARPSSTYCCSGSSFASTRARRVAAGRAMERRLRALPAGEVMVVARAPLLVQRLLTIVGVALALLLTYSWLTIVLRRFPYTRPWGRRSGPASSRP